VPVCIVICGEGVAGSEVGQCRCVSRRCLGTHAGGEIKFSHALALLRCRDQCGAPVELVRHIEQMLGELVGRHAREELAADAQVDFTAASFGTQ
jgi:hypothetical protein